MRPMRWPGQLARSASLVLVCYWGLFALLSPVTGWDAQVYNLARLPIAELHGLFGNSYWTSERQLMFPWTFDAIHLPFLHLGFGYSLPSFLCFVGTLVVTWMLIARRHNPEAGWIAVLALLGLPTLVFQSVGTKNDIALLFGVATWLYSLSRWREDGRILHLVFCATAVSFLAGAKTSGLFPALLCGVITLWALRRNRSALIRFSASLLVFSLLLGSVETYGETYRRYGHLLGPTGLVQDNRNSDGLRGTAANALRYAMGNINLGIEPWQTPNRVTPIIENSCRRLLSMTGLENAGYRHSDYSDSRLEFLKTGWDASSDFGPLGTVCLLVLLLTALWWRPAEVWWRFGCFGGGIFLVLCYSVAWMPWNNRLLLIPFSALTIALVSFVYQHLNARLGPVVGLLLVSIYSALVFPLASFNKRPRDLLDAIWDRQREEMKERSSMIPVLTAVRDWHRTNPHGRLFLLAGSDSWVLPFFTSPQFAAEPITSSLLPTIVARNANAGFPAALLILNRPDFFPGHRDLNATRRFREEPGTALYAIGPVPTHEGQPQVGWREGHFADGWSADVFKLEVKNWVERTLTLNCWNPTPLTRAITLETSQGVARWSMQPDERASLSVTVNPNDTITVIVSPGFVPHQQGVSPDSRSLGLLVELPISAQ